jgi:hypothetical protein
MTPCDTVVVQMSPELLPQLLPQNRALVTCLRCKGSEKRGEQGEQFDRGGSC